MDLSHSDFYFLLRTGRRSGHKGSPFQLYKARPLLQAAGMACFGFLVLLVCVAAHQVREA